MSRRKGRRGRVYHGPPPEPGVGGAVAPGDLGRLAQSVQQMQARSGPGDIAVLVPGLALEQQELWGDACEIIAAPPEDTRPAWVRARWPLTGPQPGSIFDDLPKARVPPRPLNPVPETGAMVSCRRCGREFLSLEVPDYVGPDSWKFGKAMAVGPNTTVVHEQLCHRCRRRPQTGRRKRR